MQRCVAATLGACWKLTARRGRPWWEEVAGRLPDRHACSLIDLINQLHVVDGVISVCTHCCLHRTLGPAQCGTKTGLGRTSKPTSTEHACVRLQFSNWPWRDSKLSRQLKGETSWGHLCVHVNHVLPYCTQRCAGPPPSCAGLLMPHKQEAEHRVQ